MRIVTWLGCGFWVFFYEKKLWSYVGVYFFLFCVWLLIPFKLRSWDSRKLAPIAMAIIVYGNKITHEAMEITQKSTILIQACYDLLIAPLRFAGTTINKLLKVNLILKIQIWQKMSFVPARSNLLVLVHKLSFTMKWGTFCQDKLRCSFIPQLVL